MADNPINLATLQQQDPYITEILGMATQVQLYNYNQSIKNEWDKTDASGPLFVYKRSACPTHGMIILNKQSLENWVEPITDQMEFQVQTPFLLYRSSRRIEGLWFYKPTECEELADLMQKLKSEAVRAKQSSAAGGGQGGSVDILQILSGAQQRYENKAKGGPDPQSLEAASLPLFPGGPQVIKPTPLKLPAGAGSGSDTSSEGPSQLQELFKTVKLTQQLQQRPGGMVDQYTGDPPPDVTIHPLHRSLSVAEVESGAPAGRSGTVTLSSGGLTVAEIERQQREQIPVPDSSGQGQGQSQGQSQGADGGMSQSPSTKELLNLIVAAASGDRQGGNLPAMPQLQPTGTGDGGIKASTTSTILMTPGDFEKQPAAPTTHKEPSSVGLGATCPDVLLTPMAFGAPRAAASVSPPSAVNPSALLEQLNGLKVGSPASPGFVSPPPSEATPLTKQQLQQALIHMIRVDDDFVTRLHESYLISFRQQLGGGKR